MEQPENNTSEENVVLSIDPPDNDIIPDSSGEISNTPENPVESIVEEVSVVENNIMPEIPVQSTIEHVNVVAPVIPVQISSEPVSTVVNNIVPEIPVQISRNQVSSIVNTSVKDILSQVTRDYVNNRVPDSPRPIIRSANTSVNESTSRRNSVSESAAEGLPPTENVQLTVKPKKQVHLNHNHVDWFAQTEYIVFINELKAIQRNNLVILKECKENKRLLDLKYDDLNTLVNNIQTSVIFFSTISGFIQATRIQFNIADNITSIFSITVSTYISLLLSISKYYKLDEIKEKIQTLREKYSLLHNKLDHRMDIVGPWAAQKLWVHQDPAEKYKEWSIVRDQLDDEYSDIIVTKQTMSTEFEVIMDTKSRNQYFIKNRELNYRNRELVFSWDKKETALEKRIVTENVSHGPSSIKLQHEELDNWAEEV
jgi:hypothetical protein